MNDSMQSQDSQAAAEIRKNRKIIFGVLGAAAFIWCWVKFIEARDEQRESDKVYKKEREASRKHYAHRLDELEHELGVKYPGGCKHHDAEDCDKIESEIKHVKSMLGDE